MVYYAQAGVYFMDNRELRKLGRKDLLEIILEQTKRIEKLELDYEKVKKELNEKKILIQNAGSIAEASLALSSIFESADEAAKTFINNVEEFAKQEEKNIRKELKELKKKKIAEIEKECEKRLLNAEKEIKKLQKLENKVKDNNKTKNAKKTIVKKDKVDKING